MKKGATLLKSLSHAMRGLGYLLAHERNARIEAAFALLALGLCAWFKVQTGQWVVVLLCIAGVLSAEAANTAFEALADVVHPKRHAGIGVAKDLAAAAVLLWVLISLIVGWLVFWPYLRGAMA